MKTLQEWIRRNPFEEAVRKCNQTNAMRQFYEKLQCMPDAQHDPKHVLFVSKYIGWRADEKTNYTASVFCQDSDSEPSPALTPWVKLMGYSVSDMSVESYGVKIVLDAILKDMTFFGTEEADVEDAHRAFDSLMTDVMNAEDLDEDSFLETCGITKNELQMSLSDEQYAQSAYRQNAAVYESQIAGILALLKQ